LRADRERIEGKQRETYLGHYTVDVTRLQPELWVLLVYGGTVDAAEDGVRVAALLRHVRVLLLLDGRLVAAGAARARRELLPLLLRLGLFSVLIVTVVLLGRRRRELVLAVGHGS
jgi:hypothetical protein